MTVQRVLTNKGGHVVSVSPDDTLQQAAKILSDNKIGAVLALTGQAIAGVLSERDIVRVVGAEGATALEAPVSSVMTTTVITCTSKDPIAGVMATMTDRRIRHMPVVEEGKLIGIVTMGDLVKIRIEESEQEAAALRDYIKAG